MLILCEVDFTIWGAYNKLFPYVLSVIGDSLLLFQSYSTYPGTQLSIEIITYGFCIAVCGQHFVQFIYIIKWFLLHYLTKYVKQESR